MSSICIDLSAVGPPRVVVAIPSSGQVHHACMESVRAMMSATRSAEVTYWWHNGQPHDRCRNALLDRFASELSWTHLLFVDTDVVVAPDALERLLSHRAPVVAASVPCLHRRYGPPDGPPGTTVGTNVMVFDDPGMRGTIVSPEEAKAGYRRVDPDDFPSEPFTCDATGLGLCLLERRVIEAIERPWCRFVGQFDGELVGEDVYMMRRVRAAGFDILIDPRVECDHYKTIDLTHLDLLYADQPPVSPWPARQTNVDMRPVFVGIRVPYTGWLDVRTLDVVNEWQTRFGDRVAIELIKADTLRGGFREFAARFTRLDRSFNQGLFLNDDVVPFASLLGLLHCVDSPIVSALTRSLVDEAIRWSFSVRDTLAGSLDSPQNIELPGIEEPFAVDAIDPVCALVSREALTHVGAALSLDDNGPDADRQFARRWCQAVARATGRQPLQIPVTVERRAEVGLRGLLNLKLRLKSELRERLAARQAGGLPSEFVEAPA